MKFQSKIFFYNENLQSNEQKLKKTFRFKFKVVQLLLSIGDFSKEQFKMKFLLY